MVSEEILLTISACRLYGTTMAAAFAKAAGLEPTRGPAPRLRRARLRISRREARELMRYNGSSPLDVGRGW